MRSRGGQCRLDSFGVKALGVAVGQPWDRILWVTATALGTYRPSHRLTDYPHEVLEDGGRAAMGKEVLLRNLDYKHLRQYKG